VRHTAWLLVAAVLACGPAPDAPLERFTVPAGAGLAQVTDTLVARGLVAHPRWFTLVARVRGLDRTIKAGVYELPAGTSASAILTTLATGQEAMQRLTIPEGLTREDVGSVVEASLGIDAGAFVAATRDTKLVRRVSPNASHLEGYLYPETYVVPVSMTTRRLVETMVAAFLEDWSPGWDRRLDTLGLTRHELVTLASIVEGEAQVSDERPIIAGVYHNRLRQGMRLQADPTVQYAIQQATGRRKTRLFLKDYEFQSPYNTYLIDGLPPGPVSSPGRASIEAALYPADVPYLYFVASSGGRHVFTATYQEHLDAIRRIRSP
jgi:UPF0755 protein